MKRKQLLIFLVLTIVAPIFREVWKNENEKKNCFGTLSGTGGPCDGLRRFGGNREAWKEEGKRPDTEEKRE